MSNSAVLRRHFRQGWQEEKVEQGDTFEIWPVGLGCLTSVLHLLTY